MLKLDFLKPKNAPFRLLCLGAHCDDIEIGCGGTVLSLLRHFDHSEVYWRVFSSNDIRQLEAIRSANIFLGDAHAKRIEIGNFRDSFFPYVGDKIKDEFEVLKREFEPDLVLTHYRDDRHQDHRLISDLTWNTFRNHMILEYEIPKYDGDIGQPSLFVPISEHNCLKKTETILSCFQSQKQKPWFDSQTFMAIMRLRGMEANSPTKHAEAFFGRKLVCDICQ